MYIKQENKDLLKKIKLISNEKRFFILLLTQNTSLNITELSSKLNLAYNKCADYVTLLAKHKLVTKTKKGKEIFVKSEVIFECSKIGFKQSHL